MLVTVDSLATLAAASMAVAAASLTLSKAHVFAWLREAVARRSAWLGQLVSCPYCTSHWIAAAAVWALRYRVTAAGTAADWLVAWLATVTLSGVWAGLVYRAYARMTMVEKDDGD